MRAPTHRIAEYHEIGIDEFILSGYPHLEEADQVGEDVMPVLRRRGRRASRSDTPGDVILGLTGFVNDTNPKRDPRCVR